MALRQYSFAKFSIGDVEHRAFPAGQATFDLSERLDSAVGALLEKYGATFPGRAAPIVGIAELAGRNGASGYWCQAPASDASPIFMMEIAAELKTAPDFEAILAHELAHPLLRLAGIRSATSVPPIDERIGHELSSTSQHPAVFKTLDEWGYGDDQVRCYEVSALHELDKLSTTDLAASTYTAPPGQTWLALWYFNFRMLAPAHYAKLEAFHAAKAPAVAAKMRAVSECWKRAERQGRENFTMRTRIFQQELMKALDLHGRVQLQSFEQWKDWLFPIARSPA